jgi:hypothetical protein
LNFATIPLTIFVFIIPGYAWLFLSGLTRRLDILGSAALSFVLSICFLSLASAGLSLVTSHYLFYSTVLTLALSLGVIGLCAITHRQIIPSKRTTLTESKLVLLLCVLGYVVFLVALYWSSPYYPTSYALDPLNHVQLVDGIFAGSGREILLHTYSPVGMHFVAAIIVELLNISALQSLRILLSFVLLDIVVLIYLSANALLGDQKLAAVAAIVGAFVIPADATHFALIGTYPNIPADAIVFAMLFLFFAYLSEPSWSVGVSLALLGLGGFFIHSSILLFLGILWLFLPILALIHRGNRIELRRHALAALSSSAGILLAGLFLIGFFEKNLQRIMSDYFILGGTTLQQLPPVLRILYETLAWNFVFFVKPVVLIAIGLGIIFIAMKQRKHLGRLLVSAWIVLLVILAFVSGETDRFVLFSMLPALFIVGNLLGATPSLTVGNFVVDRRKILPAILILLVVTGGFMPLLPLTFNPQGRLHQQDVMESMDWLKQNQCPSQIASIGLYPDYRYLTILTGLPYAGDLLATTSPSVVLQDSAARGYRCVVMQTDNPNYTLFSVNQSFQQKYRNTELAIFFITR